VSYQDEEADDPPKRRKEDTGLPPWAKLAITVAGTTISTIIILMSYMSREFVSRVEYANHSSQQAADMMELKQTQLRYAAAEAVTAAGLTELKVDVAEIKGDVGWLRSYLDVSQPPPRKNGKR